MTIVKKRVSRGLNILEGFIINGNHVTISDKVKNLEMITDKHMNFNDQRNGIVKVTIYETLAT